MLIDLTYRIVYKSFHLDKTPNAQSTFFEKNFINIYYLKILLYIFINFSNRNMLYNIIKIL